MVKINLLQHSLVPPHRILSEEEKRKLLSKLNISEFQLPSIRKKDPIALQLDAKVGNVLEILRESKMGQYKYYRRVI